MSNKQVVIKLVLLRTLNVWH